MDFSFGIGNALENCDRFILYPIGEAAGLDQLADLAKGAPVGVVMVLMFFFVLMSVAVRSTLYFIMIIAVVLVFILVFMVVVVAMVVVLFVVMMMMFMTMIVCVDIKLHAFNAGFVLSGGVGVKVAEIELRQLLLQLIKWHPEVQQRTDKHIARNPAKNIQIQRLHVR